MPWVKSKIIFLTYKTLPGMPSTHPSSKQCLCLILPPPPPPYPTLFILQAFCLLGFTFTGFQSSQIPAAPESPGRLVKTQMLGLIPRILGFGRSGVGPTPAFRTNSPIVPMPLFQSPDFGNHWTINPVQNPLSLPACS